MNNSPGEQMVLAMKSILKMQSDSIKLFEDLDKSMPGLESFYRNVVTLGLGNSMSSRHYLAEGLIRLYFRPGNKTDFLGINICFYDLNDPKFIEPILVAARIVYEPVAVDQSEKIKRGWDPWYAFLSWIPERMYGQPITIKRPKRREAIEEITVAATPLFAITNLESALALIDLVGRP